MNRKALLVTTAIFGSMFAVVAGIVLGMNFFPVVTAVIGISLGLLLTGTFLVAGIYVMYRSLKDSYEFQDKGKK